MLKQLLLLVSLIALVSAVAGEDVTSARLGQFPYHVSIQVAFNGKDYEHYCGGVIIWSNVILTAAHCLQYDQEIYRVVAGTIQVDDLHFPRPQIREPQKFHTDPSFSMINHLHLPIHDIGLIVLKESLKFNEFVKPINIPDLDKPAENHRELKGNATLLGWGTTFTSLPYNLRYAVINIPDQYKCNEYHMEFKREMHLCVYPTYGPCSGINDNGAVLIQDNVVVAVVSVVGYPCELRSPIIYTKITSVIEYMKTYLKH